MAKKHNERLIDSNESNPYILLCSAILKQGMIDLKKAIKYGDKRKEKSLKKWFLSDYGQALSFNQGEYLIEQVEKSCRKE